MLRIEPPQFNIRTLVAFSATTAALAALARYDVVSFISGLGLLFALFLFAEDIWPWLGGEIHHK